MKNKKDLRERCREKYGDDFVELYDQLCRGCPIGDFVQTIQFIALVEAVKNEMKNKRRTRNDK